MTAKEFLSQARYLDMRINSKLEQVDSLNALATKCTSTLTGMPHNPSQSTSHMADAVVKIVDLQNEINHDIDCLIDLKREIAQIIKSVSDLEMQTLLEKRYLCFQSWEKISVDMKYSIDNIYRLHRAALKVVDEVKTIQ